MMRVNAFRAVGFAVIMAVTGLVVTSPAGAILTGATGQSQALDQPPSDVLLDQLTSDEQAAARPTHRRPGRSAGRVARP